MPNPVSMENGVITSGVWKNAWYDIATWPVSLDAVTENQTVHIGLSVKWHGAAATTGTAWASIRYADAAGNTNTADAAIDGITTEWQRFSLSVVMPSGMRLTDCHISAQQLDAAYDVTAPCMSYGSPVSLAVASHTPYATQGHLEAVYATQASLKVANDSIESEVKARAELSDAVSDLSTTVSQTADSITASVTSLRAEMSSRASSAASQLDSLGEGVGDARKAVDALERTVSSSLRFGADGVELGRSDSNTTLKMGADRMSFVNNGNEVMYITGDRLFINSAQVVRSQQVGQYMWFTRENGNMGLKWVNG
jgi:hypothetical protein